MDDELWGLLLLIAATLVYAAWSTKKQKNQMEQAAASLGMEFREGGGALPFRKFTLLNRGYLGGSVFNFARGEVSDREVILLEHEDQLPSMVSAVRVAGLSLPAFLLEAVPDSPTGMRFDSCPQFSKTYRLTGPDEIAIRQLFCPSVLEFFQMWSGSVECDGEWMVIYGIGSTHYNETLMRKALRKTERLLDVFRGRSQSTSLPDGSLGGGDSSGGG